MNAPALLLLLCAAPAAAPPLELDRAIALFNEAEFEKAKASLSRLLYPKSLLNMSETLTAHAYLAATLLAFEDEEAVRREVRALLELNRDYKLSARFDPQLRRIAEEVRVTLITEPPKPPKPSGSLEQTGTQSSFHWYRVLPFGVAQFIDRRSLLGGVYLGLGAGSLAANITTSLLLDREKRNGTCARNCTQLQLTQNVFFGAVIAVAVWSVIDAIIFAPED